MSFSSLKRINLSFLLLAFAFLISTNYVKAAKKQELENTSGTELELFVDTADLSHSLDEGDLDLRIYFDASSLLKGKTFPQYIKIEIYDLIDEQKHFLAILNTAIKNQKEAGKVFFSTVLPRVENSTKLHFDIYDSANHLDSSFTQEVTIADAQQDTELVRLTNFDCDFNDGECLLEYILSHINFSASSSSSFRTEVLKNKKGSYQVNIPVKTKKFKLRKQLNLTGTNKVSSDPSDSIPNDEEVLLLDRTELLDNPISGALEYDGKNLYFTNESSRKLIGKEGPPGPPGPRGVPGESAFTSHVTFSADGNGARVSSNVAPGQLTLAPISGATRLMLSQGAGGVSIVDSGPVMNPQAALHVRSGSATEEVTIFQAASSQTVNISEWQDSNGSLIASLDRTGVLTLSDGGVDSLFLEYSTYPKIRTTHNNLTFQTNGTNNRLQFGNSYATIYGAVGSPTIQMNSTVVGINQASPQRALHINDVMRLEPRSAAPSSPATGDIYVDSDATQAICIYLNGAWVVMAGTGSCS